MGVWNGGGGVGARGAGGGGTRSSSAFLTQLWEAKMKINQDEAHLKWRLLNFINKDKWHFGHLVMSAVTKN